MTLRERIKELCKERNISLNKLETDCGFAKGYASKLDKSTPNSENLQRIADYFEVSVDYLMNGKEPTVENTFGSEYAKLVGKIRNDTELSKALLKYFGFPDAKKKHVIELINLLSE